jgi:hypothetical protein
VKAIKGTLLSGRGIDGEDRSAATAALRCAVQRPLRCAQAAVGVRTIYSTREGIENFFRR